MHGVSAGAGPFTAYRSVRAPSSPALPSGSRPSYPGRGAAAARQAERERRRAQRDREIAETTALEQALVTVHLTEFAVAQPPKAQAPAPVEVEDIRERRRGEMGLPGLEAELRPYGAPPTAPRAEPVDRAALSRERVRTALRKVPLIRFGERRQVKADMLARVEVEVQAENERRQQAAAAEQQRLTSVWNVLEERRARVERDVQDEASAEQRRRGEAQRTEQTELDREWQALLANDPETVIAVLEEAFEDNEAPAAPIDCRESGITVMLRFSSTEVIPERRPDVTPSGRPTLKKRSKTDRNELYLEALGSNVLATVREAFAVAPNIGEARVVVIREEVSGSHAGKLAAIYAARFDRSEARKLFSTTAPSIELMHADEAIINLRGQTREVSPLDLSGEPELQATMTRLARDLAQATRT